MSTGFPDLYQALGPVLDLLPTVSSCTETGCINMFVFRDSDQVFPPVCTVTRADRVVWLHAKAIQMRGDCLEPFVHEGRPHLRIHSTNRGPIVYRLTGYAFGNDCYLAELVD